MTVFKMNSLISISLMLLVYMDFYTNVYCCIFFKNTRELSIYI